MTPSSTTGALSRPASSAGLIILLGAITALGPAATDMYLPALPTIASDLSAAAGDVQLTLAVYFIGMALGQLLYGPVSDRLGRKGPLLVGLGLFVLASAGSAFAPNIGLLIAFRFLQAMGGCASAVLTRAIVRDAFPVQDAARVFSLMTLVMGVAPILSPMAGAALMGLFGWRSIFWALAIFGALALVASVMALPETRAAAPKQAAQSGSFGSNLTLLLKDRSFMGFTLAGGMAQAGMFAYIAGSPFVFIDLHHVSAAAFSWIFGVNAAGLILASQLNGWLVKTHSPHRLLRLSVLLPAFFGLSLAATATTGLGGIWGLLIPLFGYVSSMGLVFPNATATALEAHGPRAGFASAVMGALQFGLAAVSSAMIGRLNDGTAVPLGLVIGACGLLSLLSHRLLAKRQPAPEAA